LAKLAVEIAVKASEMSRSIQVDLLPSLSHTQHVYKALPSGPYYGTAFERLINRLAEDNDANAQPGSHIRVVAAEAPALAQLESVCRGHANSLARSVGSISQTTTSVGKATVMTVASEPERAHVGLVTILPSEMAAVNKWLSAFPGACEWHADNRWWISAKVPTRSGPLSIVATQALTKGDESMLNACYAMAPHRPKLLVLLGIAGGIHDDVKLGDVVLATDVFGYDRREVRPEGMKRRAEPYQQPAAMQGYLNRFFALEGNDEIFLPGTPSKPCEGADFKVLSGPIGTGKAVIKDSLADEREWLTEVNSQILVVETEGAGPASYFHEHRDKDQLEGYVIIRAVSDHADIAKNNLWHKAAPENATIVLDRFLDRVSDALLTDDDDQ
jgi:adenosylhomocysteine nucleosidase